ncbi:MAG: carboxypeptidase Q [Arcticibacterium sp.]|jgi:carboxypeptidase Q
MSIKHNWYLVFVLFLFSAFLTQKKGRLAIFEKINSEVNKNGQAYSTLDKLIKATTHRLTGSENGRKAEEFAFKAFQDFGYSSAAYLPFETESWSRRSVTLSLVPDNSDNFREVEVVSLAHSPKAASVTAKIVNCKDGLKSDFELIGEELKGKIALFNINIQYRDNKGKLNLHRSEKTALAIKYGAAGVIIANSVKGGVLLTGTASATGELIPIPAVCVSYESGRYMKNWIKDETHILAQIEMLNSFKPVRARNILAKHKGSTKYQGEKIIVGAHLDSWDLANGAIDNGIGAASVMDVARVFKKLNLKTKRPIEFILFMGEEQGRLGSKALVEELKRTGEIDNIGLMINLDMTSNILGFNAFGNSKLEHLTSTFGKEINTVDKNYQNLNTSNAGLHSDHQSFMMEGIPVTRPNKKLAQKAQDCYHADCDTFDLVSEIDINNNVKYTAMMLYALANADKLPPRKTLEETKEYLISQNLKEALILGKEWFWKE